MQADAGEGKTRLEAALAAAAGFVRARPDDRIGLVGFARYPDLVCPPTLDHEAALERLLAVRPVAADGDEDATGIGHAVAFAVLALDRAATRGKVVVLLTDGEVTNTDAVIDLATRHAGTARFFTFGIGAGASQHLVKGLARASRGAAEFISPGERIEAKVMRQFTRVFAPAMTGVKVAVREMSPAAERVALLT